MSKKEWKQFCIVGLGKHANKKLIPALYNAKKKISGLVTSQNKNKFINYKCFKTIDQAVNNLPKDTVFVLSSPPEIHGSQIFKILKYGRDIIIEKPCFIKLKDIENTMSLPHFKDNIILEGFMNRYTLLYKKFIDLWSKYKNETFILKSNFHLPEIPQNSFRDSNKITSSCLYDMGCYGLSLLNDIGLSIKNVDILDSLIVNGKIINVKLAGKVNNIIVQINFGIGDEYENYVELVKFNNDRIKLFPFFKGIEENKNIEYIQNGKKELKQIYDHDGFEEMFKSDKQKLFLSQELRFRNMFIVTEKLNDLEFQIKKFL